MEQRLLEHPIIADPGSCNSAVSSHFYDFSHACGSPLAAFLPSDLNNTCSFLADWATIDTNGKADARMFRDGQILLCIIISDGTPFVLDLVQAGSVDMDLGKSLDWTARAAIDAYLRTLCNVPLTHNEAVSFYIFDAATAKDAGVPATFLQGYGTDYVDGFDHIWGLK